MPSALRYPTEVMDGVIAILRSFRTDQVATAIAAINARHGTRFTTDSLGQALKRRGLGCITSHMDSTKWGAASAPTARAVPAFDDGAEDVDLDDLSQPPPPVVPLSRPTQRDAIRPPAPVADAPPARRFAALLDATRRGPIAFDALCDKLDAAPRKVRALVEAAQSAGLAIEVAHDTVAFKLAEPSATVRDVDVSPTTSGPQVVGVISDTHLGSRYCLRAQLREFVEYAYSRGAREILHPGDVLDGCYRHGTFELTHSGIEEQTRDLFEVLPALPGLTYHCITGNHDDTFADHVGMDPGGYVQNWFEARGRRDVKFHGRRGAYLRIRGAVVELWHPKKSPGYAVSYGLQNHIRDYGVGQKPDVLLVGHWHTWCYLEQRGVHALACGTFQGSGSAFGKSLGGAPSMGGTLLTWETTATRTLRRFAVERRAYFEREDVREAVPA